MLQIVFSTDGLAKVLATNNGPVRIYPTTAGSEWPVPNEKFVLWSTRPENAAWIELAKNAEAIVYWNAADANVNVLDEVLRAKLVTIADHTGSDELGTLLGTHPRMPGAFCANAASTRTLTRSGSPPICRPRRTSRTSRTLRRVCVPRTTPSFLSDTPSSPVSSRSARPSGRTPRRPAYLWPKTRATRSC